MRSLAILALVGMLALAAWIHGQRNVPWLLWGGDETEFADIGRHLARGQGFTTGIIYPVEIGWGIGEDHPSLVRAPVWPAVLAVAFAIAGPVDGAVYVALLAFWIATVVLAAALAMRAGGHWLALLVGIALCTSPTLMTIALMGGAEMAFTCFLTLTFLLFAHEAGAFWVGVASALVYLTRYNGMSLFPVAALLLLTRDPRLKTLFRAVAGFALVAAPWWLRNAWITGDPFFSIYNWTPWVTIAAPNYTLTLIHLLNPDVHSPFAMDPFEKARRILPQLVRYWPPAAFNIAATAGVTLAAIRGARLAVGWVLLAVGTTLGLAFALPRGRYFVPLFPVLLALGATGWLRYGGRLAILGLVLLVSAPLLPSIPAEFIDLQLFRKVLADGSMLRRRTEWAPCLTGKPLVVAEDAPLVNWVADTTVIWLPATPEDFWRVAEAYPVEFVQNVLRKDILSERFHAAFSPRPDCGPHLYQRIGPRP